VRAHGSQFKTQTSYIMKKITRNSEVEENKLVLSFQGCTKDDKKDGKDGSDRHIQQPVIGGNEHPSVDYKF